MKQKITPWVRFPTLVLLSVFLLAGCGFKLRGSETLPLQLRSLYVPAFSADMQLYRELTTALSARQVKLADSAKNAAFTVQLLNSNISQTLTSTSTDMQLRNYLIVYSLQYQVFARDGHRMVPPATITLTRNYTASITQLLNETGDNSNVRQNMRQDLIKQIIERLRYLKVNVSHADQR
jgi:LPS-assembly lipoprotein